MSGFDKSALFAALKPKMQTVTLEGFGELSVMQLSVRQVEALRADVKKDDTTDNFSLRLVQLCVFDAQGQQVFDAADITAMQDFSNSGMDELVNHALIVNGFQKAAKEKN